MDDGKMSSAFAQKMALHLCMQGMGRYIECLHWIVNTYDLILPPEFVKTIRTDFEDYARKMKEAGLPFRIISATGESHEG